MATIVKRVLMIAPHHMHNVYKHHFSSQGYVVSAWKDSTDFIDDIQTALDDNKGYAKILIDITTKNFEFEKVAENLQERNLLEHSHLIVGAPDIRKRDAQMLVSLGYHEILLESQLIFEETDIKNSKESEQLQKTMGLQGHEHNVLVVSPDASGSKIVQFVIKRMGFGCIISESIDIAIQLVAHNPFTAVFVDVGGFAFDDVSNMCIALRKRNAGFMETPVIGIVGAQKADGVREFCFNMGIKELLKKPLDTTVLKVILHRLFSKTT